MQTIWYGAHNNSEKSELTLLLATAVHTSETKSARCN